MKNRKWRTVLAAGVILSFSVVGCTAPWAEKRNTETENTTLSAEQAAAGSGLELSFDEEDRNAAWSAADSTQITLSGNTASVSGSGASVSGQTVLISSAGTYVVSGALTDGCIQVSCTEKGTVRLVLNGMSVSSSDKAPLVVEEAGKVIITLADGTENIVTDSARGSTAAEDYSAAVSSRADLVFNGTGTLNVTAGYRNGIKSSDDLKVVSGYFNINSAEDGMIGKDLLGIENGSFVIHAGTDGMKSTCDTDTSRGNIIINSGTYQIEAQNDGIQAENILQVNGGDFDIQTGGGAASAVMKTGDSAMMGGGRFGSTQASSSTADTDSAKGLKADTGIYIVDGSFRLDCMDDAVHTNDLVCISDGTFTIQTGDDGVHADSTLQIDGGDIEIQKCYEGLEAAKITINGGRITISASDDGINAASGSTDTSAGMGGFYQGKASSGSASSDISLVINGGEIFVNADGDGLDSNGNITVNGGQIVVCGPTSNNDAALDFDGSMAVNGGVLMAFGSSGMLETPNSAENGCCIVTAFTAQQADTEFVLSTSDGTAVLSYTPVKAYASAIVYSSEIQSGSTYTVQTGDASWNVTVSDAVTTNGTGGMGGGAPGGNPGTPGGGNAELPGGAPDIPDDSGIPGDTKVPGNPGDSSHPGRNAAH